MFLVQNKHTPVAMSSIVSSTMMVGKWRIETVDVGICVLMLILLFECVYYSTGGHRKGLSVSLIKNKHTPVAISSLVFSSMMVSNWRMDTVEAVTDVFRLNQLFQCGYYSTGDT